ncbi:MAG: hypothetical protein AAFX03_09885 [Pseudomonadota bacterium]
MRPERVFELIEAYGADPAAWPEDERDAGREALAADPDAFEAAVAGAGALDAALGGLEVAEPPPGLAARILEAAPAPARPSFASRLKAFVAPGGRKWPAATAFASTLIGVTAGYGGMAAAATAQYEAEAALYAAFDTSYALSFDESDG